MPVITTSIHGRQLGLDEAGRLLSKPNKDPEPRPLGRLAYANIAASAAISNTTAETAFDASYSIPAGNLRPGSLIKVRYQGIVTAQNATDTLLVRLRIGGVAGTALLTGTATDAAVSDVFAGEWTGIIRTIGASGTIVGYGTHVDVPEVSGTAVHDVTEILASTAIDTTVAQVLNATATWSVASASNSCRLDLMVVEIW